MGNVQPSYSSPFIFQPCDIPAKPFAAENRGISRRRVQTTVKKSTMEDRGSEEESSTTSSIPASTGSNNTLLRSRSRRTILQQLIELQDWQRVLCRMELYPEEINQYFPIFVDVSKLEPISPTFRASMPTNHNAIIFVTPLHLVCALNPPMVVVSTILRLGGPEIASVTICPDKLRTKRTLKKQFWQHRRSHMIRPTANNKRHRHNPKSDDQSQISDSTPSMPSKWQILQTASSDSSAWNHKINFRFSFDDYKRRVKYAIKQRRSRGGAFPIVEALHEDSSDDGFNDSQYHSVNMLDSPERLETQPSSIAAGKISTAVTADCSHSHQSSISATPPRSSISDQSVILQLSSSGGVRPLPLRKVQTAKSIGISSEKYNEENELEIASPYMNDKCQPLSSTDRTKHSPIFRFHWDLFPLLRYALEEGRLLPLHVALLYSASSDIIQALVVAYPLAALRDVFGMLPIHLVAAGWLLPPLLPSPIVVAVESIHISNSLETTDDTILHSAILQNLTTLQNAVPDSARIRSGNHGMKPEEYINECMEDGTYKDECLLVLREGLAKLPCNDASRLFDIDTSITSSSDDIFDFNDTINGSVDDCIDNNMNISHSTLAGSEPPFEYLSSLMATRDWHSVNVAIELYPSLAATWIYGIDDVSAGIYKRLPLHCACIYGGPIDIITMLIKLHPKGIKTSDPSDSSTPLSLACFANCSIDIIRLILRTYPQAIDIVNVYGQVPLHVAVLSKISYDIVELLVEESPHLVLLKDNDGLNAINYAKIVYGEKHNVHQFLLMIKGNLLTKRIHC